MDLNGYSFQSGQESKRDIFKILLTQKRTVQTMIKRHRFAGCHWFALVTWKESVATIRLRGKDLRQSFKETLYLYDINLCFSNLIVTSKDILR
jgi:hypothetical protein